MARLSSLVFLAMFVAVMAWGLDLSIASGPAAIAPFAALVAVGSWYVVWHEGGVSRFAARWVAEEEREWRNPTSPLVRGAWRMIMATGALSFVVASKWPDPVSGWLLAVVLAAVALCLLRFDVRALRADTSGHDVDILHIAGAPAAFAAVCRTCSWVGPVEATYEVARADGAGHGQPAATVIDVDPPTWKRWGRYGRDEIRRLWIAADDDRPNAAHT